MARRISYSEPRIPIMSNLTGERSRGRRLLRAAYWVATCVSRCGSRRRRWLQAAGASRFLELGPDAVLTATVKECLTPAPDADGDDTDAGARAVAVNGAAGGETAAVESRREWDSPRSRSRVMPAVTVWS